MSKVDQIDKLLPQTQCEECGYQGCRPYAEALEAGTADINLCPPGGADVVVKLAQILKKDPEPYLQAAADNMRPAAVAQIREAECIGCTKCIQACPVDAIVGANKFMHTVFAAECTGCRLCVEPCPVDCIDIVELEQPAFDKDLARKRFEARKLRLEKQQASKRAHYIEKADNNDKQAKQAYILEALKRKMGKSSK